MALLALLFPLLELFQLPIGQCLQGKTHAEKADGDGLSDSRVPAAQRPRARSIRPSQVSKRRGKRQRDQTLEDSLREVRRKQRLVPAPIGMLLGRFIPRIVLPAAALDGPAGDPPEETAAPKGYAGEQKPLRPVDDGPRAGQGDAIADNTLAEGGPPRVEHRAGGPQPVFGFETVGVAARAIGDEGEAGVESQGGEEGVAQDADVEEVGVEEFVADGPGWGSVARRSGMGSLVIESAVVEGKGGLGG